MQIHPESRARLEAEVQKHSRGVDDPPSEL